MVDRYVQARRRGLPARWTNNASHDAGYTGVPATVTALELSPLIDHVLVTDRAGQPLYDSTPSTANTDPSAADAITRVRAIPKTPEQAAAWTKRYTAVAASVDELGIRDQANIAPVMDRLELAARDIASSSRPRHRLTDPASPRPARTRRAIAADQAPVDEYDVDGPDYDGPTHHHGGHGHHR